MYSNIQSASNSRNPAIIVKKRWMVIALCLDVNTYFLLIEWIFESGTKICGLLNKRSMCYLYYCTKENAKKRKKQGVQH